MFDAHVLKVLIASPGDTAPFRDSVEQSLHLWNQDRAEGANSILLPRRWETGAVPELDGTDGQSVINRQLVDDADIVVALFHQTLGRATERAVSGTAEELERAQKAGKPVHLYFGTMPVDRDHDRDQLAALDKFRDSIRALGLYGSFSSAGDLENQVRRAVEYDITGMGLGSPNATSTDVGASLSARYDFDREPNRRGQMQARRQRLEITNSGTRTAEDTTVSLRSLEDGLIAPTLWNDGGPFTVAPHGGIYSLPVMTHSGTANRVEASFRWHENGMRSTALTPSRSDRIGSAEGPVWAACTSARTCQTVRGTSVIVYVSLADRLPNGLERLTQSHPTRCS